MLVLVCIFLLPSWLCRVQFGERRRSMVMLGWIVAFMPVPDPLQTVQRAES